jgi:hypothetical protein
LNGTVARGVGDHQYGGREHLGRKDGAKRESQESDAVEVHMCGILSTEVLEVMTREQLAATLNGREYTNEIAKAEEKIAKENGLLVIFGASDDLCELRGAIYGEAGYGQDIFILDGKFLEAFQDDDVDVLKRHGVLGVVNEMRERAIKIEALWCDGDISWTYKTNTPHSTFDIMEDGEIYCRGIVIDMKEVK